jgi:23S rRNA (guanosine2251-2'-O)-methyltransferase
VGHFTFHEKYGNFNDMTHDFYIYGRNAVIEQLRNNPKNLKRILIKDGLKDRVLDEIRKLAQAGRVAVQPTDEKEIAKILKDDVAHQGVIALSKPFEYTSFDEWVATADMTKLPTVLILDHIQDVSNLGAIIRSATGAGVDAVIVAELNQAPITSAVYKTSAGTVGRIPVIQVGNLNQTIEKLKKKGFWVAGLGMEGATNYWEYTFDTPTAIVIGNEGDGMREKTGEHCDVILSIPMMNQVESLNASVSSALVCYEIMRQRRG